MRLFIKFYAKSPLLLSDIEQGIASIEKITNERLIYSIDDLGKPFLFNSRKEFIARKFKKNIPLITNAIEDKMILFSGNLISYPIADMWYLTIQLRKKIESTDLRKLFMKLTEKFDAYWAKVSPSGTEGRFTMQSFSDYNPSSKNDLPKLPSILTFDSPYIPAKLGWISYWPSQTLERIGFKKEHRALFYNVQDAANDGLLLQITKHPLDFERAEHLSKTVAIYEALPAVGGRDCV